MAAVVVCPVTAISPVVTTTTHVIHFDNVAVLVWIKRSASSIVPALRAVVSHILADSV